MAFLGLAATLAACGDGATSPVVDARLELLRGGGQRTLGGWELAEPVVVGVVDAAGAPLGGVQLRFEVTAGGGVVAPATATTSSQGLASAAWRLGPETGQQRLGVRVVDGSAGLEVVATSVGTDEADLLVVRGAGAPLNGFVLVREADGLEVIAVRQSSDTLIHLPPDIPGGYDVVLFGRANRPLRARPSWTPGVDTVAAELQPPVVVDIEFEILTGSFWTQREIMAEQVATMARLWRDQGAGLAVGDVRYLDATEPPRQIDKSSSGICSGLTPGAAVEVDVVTTIDSGRFTGWGCWAGQVYMADGTERFPNLLAHELGHTFTLVHTATGMMFPSQPQTAFREGEIYRAHFHTQSVLNTIYSSQPAQWRRFCFGAGSGCLPEELDLGGGLVALLAEDAPAFDLMDAMRRGPVVDAVEGEPIRSIFWSTR